MQNTVDLPKEHYALSSKHELRLIACLLVDRKLMRLPIVRNLSSDCFLDQTSWSVLSILVADGWIGLDKIMPILRQGHAVAEIAKSIQRCWYWNAAWHASKVRELSNLRREFFRAVKVLDEHCEWR